MQIGSGVLNIGVVKWSGPLFGPPSKTSELLLIMM